MSGTRRGVCSECGGLMWVGGDSAPPDRRRCRNCQKARPKNPAAQSAPWVPQIVTCLCGEVFEQRRHGQKYCHPEHRPAGRGGRKQTKTAARGYGHEHQKRRRAALAALKPGTPCPRCGDEMRPDEHELHLDHADDDRNVYLGLSHAHCNLSAGAARGNRLRRPWWQRQRKQLALFGAWKPRRPPLPPKPPKMQRCPCGRDFPARQAGRGDRCPACWWEVAEKARRMRADGMQWQEIAEALGLCNAARAYTVAHSYWSAA